MKRKQPLAKKPVKDYENLGKILYSVFEESSIPKKVLYRTAFLKGVVSGFGSVIGATVVVALLLWILTLLADISIIGPIIESLRNTVSDPTR